MRSFGVIVGGGVGTGARSPGLIPAFSAAAVGRKTLTWREGGTGTVFCSAPFVGATTSGTTGTGSWITSSASATTSSGTSGSGGGTTSSITGASARAAGANRLTSLVTGCCGFGGADADAEIDGGGGSEVGAGAGGGVIIGSGSSTSGSASITGASG